MLALALALVGADQATAATGSGDNPVGAAVSTAVETCEAWMLHPDTRTAGADGFPAKAGLAGRLISRPSIPDAAMPPPSMRDAPHYWYIAAPSGGLFVSVSDTVRGCNVIGGAAVDLQPGVEATIRDPSFGTRWHVANEKHDGDMHSTRFASVSDKHVWMLVSRADQPGARRDRAQVAVTVGYDKAL